MESNEKINQDLILREKLAIQRTILANQTTFLAFLRTAMYFLIAGLSIHSFLDLKSGIIIEMAFYAISFVILVLGSMNYLKQKKIIHKSAIHVGRYKGDYERT
jgi:putative membrane protein